MLAARVLSGVGAAMIMPVTLAVITSTFPEEERGRAIGVWTGVAGGGGILGMFLSAALVDAASWRWLFVLPVVLVVVAAAMTIRSVPGSRARSAHRFDVVGSLTSAVAVVAVILVLQEGPERGWTAASTLLCLAVGVLAALAFVAWELRRRDAALLDVRLFRERGPRRRPDLTPRRWWTPPGSPSSRAGARPCGPASPSWPRSSSPSSSAAPSSPPPEDRTIPKRPTQSLRSPRSSATPGRLGTRRPRGQAVTLATKATRFVTVRWIFSSRVSVSGIREPAPASFLPRT